MWGGNGRDFQQAAMQGATDSEARPQDLIRHAPRGTGYGWPVAGLILLVAGLWLMGDTFNTQSVDLERVPHVELTQPPGSTYQIQVPTAGHYDVVATLDRPTTALFSNENMPVVVAPPHQVARDVHDVGVERLEDSSSGSPIKFDSLTISGPTTVTVRSSSRPVFAVYLVPEEGAQLKIDLRRVVIDALLIAIGLTLLVFGSVRRYTWGKKVRVYAAQINAQAGG
jgi:hypothetical protein